MLHAFDARPAAALPLATAEKHLLQLAQIMTVHLESDDCISFFPSPEKRASMRMPADHELMISRQCPLVNRYT